MGRIPLIRTSELPYHLYGRSNNKDWFYLPREVVWSIFVRHLNREVSERNFQVHAFVLMSNHYHLLATAAGESVDRVMCRLLKAVSDEVNRFAGRVNHLFGGPYKWSLIENWFRYHHAFRYVYQNPLRAGLSQTVEAYRYSTLRALLDAEASPVLTSHPFERYALRSIRDRGYLDWLAWLNEPYDEEHCAAMRRALYRRRFRFCPDRRTHRIPSQFGEERVTK